MKKLTTTNIRLPKEDLLIYRRIALEKGKSFSEFVRSVLADEAIKVFLGEQKSENKKFVSAYSKAPIWNVNKYKKWASKDKKGSLDHDKYIYGDPHGRGKYEWK